MFANDINPFTRKWRITTPKLLIHLPNCVLWRVERWICGQSCRHTTRSCAI